MAQSPDAAKETKLGPVRALRAVFSGVGQLLLAADRFREEEADRLQGEAQTGTSPPEDEGPLDNEPARPKMLKITGNAEPLKPAAKPAAKPARGAKGTKTAKSAKPARPAASSPARKSGSAGKAASTGKPASAGKQAGAPANAATDGAKRTAKKPGAGRAAPQQSRFRSLDSTGNVRVLTEQDKADLVEDRLDRSYLDRSRLVRPTMKLTETTPPPSYQSPGYESPSYQSPSYESPSYQSPSFASLDYRPSSYPSSSYPPPSTAPAPPAEEADPVSTVADQADLPIADYDGLSIASLRARLRGLDPAQLRQLAHYEASHANRSDIITMFENRIIKLNSAD